NAAASATPTAMIKGGQLVPEIDDAAWQPRFRQRGVALYLLGGLRVAGHDDGRIERAQDRFGAGAIDVIELPERLGGGYLFYLSDGRTTKLWRADGWTAP